MREESAGTQEDFVELAIPLPIWGRRGLERTAAESGLAAAEAAAGRDRAALRTRVKESFLDLLRSQERTAALETGKARLVELVAVLRDREEQGESAGFDVLRAERDLADLDADLHGARGDRLAARAVLAALVDLPAEDLEAAGTLEAQSPLPPCEELVSGARSRGDLVALAAEVQGLEALARSQRRGVIPEPSLTAGTKTTRGPAEHDTGPVLGLMFRLPVAERSQQARSTEAEAAWAGARWVAATRAAEADVAAACARAVARREAEQAYLGAGSPGELIRMAQAAYAAGEMTILELLDANRTVLGAALRTIDLRAEARATEVALEAAAGKELAP